MKAFVTEAGVLIPKELLQGVSEVDIRKVDHCLLVVPVEEVDPIFQLGESPVTSDATDASTRHDFYLGEA
jgi:virulence-associated protein VagC